MSIMFDEANHGTKILNVVNCHASMFHEERVFQLILSMFAYALVSHKKHLIVGCR
jgi:hypothetical protein